MKLVTKWCKGCGKLMRDVPPSKKYCETCLEKKKQEKQEKRKRDSKKPRQQKKYTAGKFKPIEQCVREAEKLGISYGVYVSRGLDKVVIE